MRIVSLIFFINLSILIQYINKTDFENFKFAIASEVILRAVTDVAKSFLPFRTNTYTVVVKNYWPQTFIVKFMPLKR